MEMQPKPTPPTLQQTRDSRRAVALRLTSDTRVLALRTPLVSNALLVVAKLIVWIVSGSVSVLSEAVHSLADLLVTTMQVASVRLAARPADENHAYGHGKFENLSAALEAVFILLTGAFVVAQAIPHIVHPAASFPQLDVGIAVMFGSAVVNLVVSVRLRAVAKLEQSPALLAEAAQLSADVATAAGVGLGLIAIRITGLTIIDPIVSLLVAGLIAKSAFDVSARAFIDLTDGRLPTDEEALIREIIDEHRGIFVGYHKLRTRRSGGGEFIDFHLQMRGDMPLKEAHDLSDTIVVAIKQSLPRAHVLIHLEPEEG
jgi:cation diffusion facilitator family transporter